MYFLLSPAKNLNESDPLPLAIEENFTKDFSQPTFMAQACELMTTIKSLSSLDIMALMAVSKKLADMNATRFEHWAWNTDKPFSINQPDTPAKPAIYLFDGDVYTGLDTYQLEESALTYLQQYLGILSGLYGLLKPLDLILPYRLEMGTKLVTPKANNLYEFWGDSITDIINQRMAIIEEENSDNVLVNLSSTEYFKAINPKKITANIITPRFEEQTKVGYKVVSVYAKKARGLMMRFACNNYLQRAEALKSFDLDGYRFVADVSTDTDYVFRRASISP